MQDERQLQAVDRNGPGRCSTVREGGLGAVNRYPVSFRRCLFRCRSCDGIVCDKMLVVLQGERGTGGEEHGWPRCSLVASVRLGFGKPKVPSGSLTPAAVSRSQPACVPFFLPWGEMRVSLAPVVCVMLHPWVLSTGSRALSLGSGRACAHGGVSGAPRRFGKPDELSKFPLVGADLVGKSTG